MAHAAKVATTVVHVVANPHFHKAKYTKPL